MGPVVVRRCAAAFTVALVAGCGGGGGGSGGGGGPAPAPSPVLTGLTPDSNTIASGATTSFAVTLDLPAPAGGVGVALSVSPTDAGTLAAVVTVPEGSATVAFDYTDAGTQTSATITAALDAVSLHAAVQTIPPSPLCVDDGYEPNDSLATATLLASIAGDQQESRTVSATACPGQSDWFRIYVQESSNFPIAVVIDVTVTWSTSDELSLELWEGTQMRGSETATDGALHARWFQSDDGFGGDESRYYDIRVRAGTVDPAGVPYTLRIEGY